MTAFRCPCGAQLKVPDGSSSKSARCPRCGQVVPIPELQPVVDFSVSKTEGTLDIVTPVSQPTHSATGISIPNVTGDTLGELHWLAGIAVKDPEAAWEARHNVPNERYERTFAELFPKGFRLISICQYFDGGDRLFAGLWVRDDSRFKWRSRHGLTPQGYDAHALDCKENGMQPLCLTGCGDAPTPRFCSIFTAEDILRVAFRDLSSAQYDQATQEWKLKGYRPIDVSGYRTNDSTLFAAVFSRDQDVKKWEYSHGLTAEQLARQSETWAAQGFQPTVICGYPWQGHIRYATIWVQE